MKNSLKITLEKISKNEELKKEFLSLEGNDLDGIHEFLSKNGYNGEKDELQKILTLQNQISDEELSSVAGGVGMEASKRLQATLLAVLALGTSSNFFGVSYARAMQDNAQVCTQSKKDETTQNSKTEEILKYFTEEKICKAQEKAYEITNKLAKKTAGNGNYLYHISNDPLISSWRRNPEKFTKLEKMLDEMVDKGDLPVKSFCIDQINLAKNSLKPDPNKNPTYRLKKNYDVLKLHRSNFSRDGEIVQLASQFNSMESPNEDFSPVITWYYDKTQGPLGSLQSTAACKHKEAAFLKGKVQDSLEEMLKKCTVKHGEKDVPILWLYPKLYKGGYFSLPIVGTENKEHLKALNDFIKENIGKLRIGSQWANCEESGRKQLHIFSAAPSFQKQAGYINWNEDFENKELYKSICTEIVKAQYKALAQIAAIKSAKTGKTAIMHVFQVGQGAFYNPPEVMDDVLKAIDEELRGFDVEVILHQRGTPKNPWNEVASKAKINLKK